MAPVEWHGDAYLAAFRRAVRKRVSAAAIFLAGDVKASISQAGGINLGRGRTQKGRFARSRVYNWTHSLPGDPPFKQTGRLRGSMAWEMVGDATGRVGTNVKYGLYLEVGAPRANLAARPYLAPRLHARRLTLSRMISAPLGPGELPAFATAGLAGSLSLGKAGAGQTRSNLARLAAETTPLI